MHPSVLAFAQHYLTPDHITGARVLEVGAYNVNGSVRPYVETLIPQCYVGVDITEGPGVDVVADCEHLTGAVGGDWDVVICTEMLEHVQNWRTCMRELVAALAPCGYLLLTTRSPGFPYHGFPGDYWRFTRTDMRAIIDGLGLDVISIQDDAPESPGVLVFARKPRKPARHASVWPPTLAIATP